MASRTVVTIVDDFDGSEDGTVETVTFSFDGHDYELDLSEQNRIAFHDAISPFIAKARRVQAPGKRAVRATGEVDAAAIRAWATANSVPVSERGRIAATVREQYAAAQK